VRTQATTAIGSVLLLAQFQLAAPLRGHEDDAAPAKSAAKSALPEHAGLKPLEAAKAMTVPEGFRVELVAGEPDVHQPIAMAIDHRGRLWVAEAYTYPKRAPDGKGLDKILILEDADGNGTFETRKVFIEGLNLVSGLELGFGGVWVGAPPYLMFIPDRDGDDKPDGPSMKAPDPALRFPLDVPSGAEVLLDGWGYEDTHETLNSFIWGPDGWLYGCHGVFTHSKVGKPGTPADKRTPINAGVWRYHPTRQEFEVFAHGTSNPWGVDFNEYGQAFITACVIPHLYHVIQGGRYQRQAGAHFNPYTYDDIKTIADHAHYAGNIADHAWWGRDEAVGHADTDAAGGGHAHCGAMIYLGDNWPEKYRGTLFMCNIHGNRVNNDVLKPRGSGYVGSHNPDFLKANDRWFRGISMRYGPDGGVYLIDWYDKNACHRGNAEIWDRTSGRVYKITYGTPKPVKVDVSKMSDKELVELQLHKNDWYVRMARRVLQERAAAGKLAAETPHALQKILDESPDTTRKLRALWALHALHRIPDRPEDADEHVAAWWIRLQMDVRRDIKPDNTSTGSEDRNASLARLLQKEIAELTRATLAGIAGSTKSSIVRLSLAAAMQRLPMESRADIAEILLTRDDSKDHNIPLMIWYGIEPLVAENPVRAIRLVRESRIPLVNRFIVRRASVDPKGLDHVLAAVSRLGPSDDELRLLMLDEIAASLRARGKAAMPAAWPKVFEALTQSKNEMIRERARFISVKFGDRSVFPVLRSILADAKADAGSREQALAALLAGKDEELPPALHKLLDDTAVRGPAIRALAAYDHADTPKAVLAQYKALSQTERQDVVTTLAARQAYAMALLKAIESGTVPRNDLSAYLVRQMERFESQELKDLLGKVWGTVRTTAADKQKLIAEHKARLTPQALAAARLSHGRATYHKTCGSCHKLFGEGGAIGPDLTGSNRANLDYILENMLDPSAVVGRDYQMTLILTTGGRSLSGLIKEENDSALTLQTANEVVVVPKEEIERRQKSELSLMPEGQLQPMSAEEVRDLVAYLASPVQIPLLGEVPAIDPKTGLVPGAIEGEAMKVLAKTAGSAAPQKMAGFPKDRWSGSDQLWWTGAGPGSKLTLELPVEQAGRYDVLGVFTKARDYGIVQVSLDGKPLGGPIDFYSMPDVITTGPLMLGTHDLKAGPHKLEIEIVGTNPKAVRAYMCGLDYVYLAKPKEQEKKK
jgi:putative membrane-bound dehydrogenase-like protein